MLTLLKIQDYMIKALRGETNVSPETLSTFKQECNDSVVKQLTTERGDFRIRMSGLGRPLCQQVLDKHGIKEDMEYNTLFRFMFGDLTESILMLIMKEAGVDIVDYQRPVELKIGNTTVQGTLDVIIRDEIGQEKVWDVKSASDWAFRYKFTGLGGYDKLKEEDPFGYVMQGFLYSEAVGLPFGGWIVVNKSSGQVAMVEVPDWSQEDKESYLKDAEERVRFLSDPNVKPFKPYKAEAETYKVSGEIVKTGNTVLPQECSMCGYRSYCWPNAILHDRVTSRAKSPPQVWYSTLKKKTV
tara:strand:- start:2568 stop:3461 length:894 start_codon:yes stop_codon:yes gene_type:complete